MDNTNRLLTKRQIADYLQTTVRHVDALVKKGMPRILVGKLVRFELVQVKDWLSAQQQPSKP